MSDIIVRNVDIDDEFWTHEKQIFDKSLTQSVRAFKDI